MWSADLGGPSVRRGWRRDGRSTSGCNRCQSLSRATELHASKNRARQLKAELRVKQVATRVRCMSFGVKMRIYLALRELMGVLKLRGRLSEISGTWEP
jgi:hypothetical protein